MVSASGGVSLSYDPAGRLHQVTGASTTRFLYDGADVIAEYNASGTVLRRYVHGPGVDEPLVWYEGSGTSDKRYLMADERGSVIGITNSGGTVTTVNRYDATGIPGTSNAGRFQYTGQMWLEDVQLYHHKARAYHPKLGRFLQTDPIGTAGGIHLYGYVGNDPVNRKDPSGLSERCLSCSDYFDWLAFIWFVRGYYDSGVADGSAAVAGTGTSGTSAPQEPQGQWPVPGHCSLNAADRSRRQGGGRFGDPRIGADGRRTTHEGIDIAAPVGTPVVAAYTGTITAIQPNPSSSYGHQVVLSVPGVGYLQYAHLNHPPSLLFGTGGVTPGAAVPAGALLGHVGRTGNVPVRADSHLHFEYRFGPGPFSPVADPLSILPTC